MGDSCYLVISDLHGMDEGLMLVKKAIEHFRPLGIISAGDQCPNPFEPIYSSFISVRGNCDRFYEYEQIPFPPLYREMSIFERNVVITHGDRFSYQDFKLEKGSVFISGHTHVPSLEKHDGIYLLNPGSPSRPRSSSGPTVGLFTKLGLALFSLLDFNIFSTLDFSDENNP